jgi:hypothetical protein
MLRTRPRDTIGRSYDHRPPRVSQAARERAQHDKIGELSDPSVCHQLQVPVVAIIG